MSVQTLDDIIEEICNALGIYGAHHDECDPSGRLRGMCRCCVNSYLRERIEAATEVERKLRA